MTTVPPSRRVYVFGSFRADFDSYEILKYGVRLHVQTQPVRVLGMLVERAGHLVTRQEIVDQLWPGHTVEEFDDSLNSTMKKLREALGDDSSRPLYIETVPRRGYRFIAPVQVETRADERPSVVESETPTVAGADRIADESQEKTVAKSRVRRHVATLTAGAVIAALMLGGFLLVRWNVGAAAGPAIHSIAVLPFENLSGDPKQDYFAEGLTDAVTTDLAQLGTVKVISRASASHYRGGHNALVPQIGRELGTDAILEGTIVHAGGKVRVNAQLVYAAEDRHIWAQSFERDEGDILALQDDLAQSVAGRIQAAITPEQRMRFNEARTVNVQAYQEYLGGMHDLNYHRTNNELRRSLEEFDQATTLDPKLAAAYAGKAIAYNLLGDYDAMHGAEAGPKAESAARQALEIDPSLASAHAALAFAEWKYDWDWDKAEEEFRKSLDLNANNAHTHHIYGVYLACRGNFAGAEEQMRKAKELDPLSMIIRTNTGWMRYFQHNFAGAESIFVDVLKVDPGFLPARQKLWITYAKEGKTEQAGAELENLMRLFGHGNLLQAVEKSKPEMRYETAVRAYVDSGELSAYEKARYLALLGKGREAVESLKEAARQRSSWIVYLRIEPTFDGMRAMPEFEHLAKEARIPEMAGR